jgi:hypothetical protein
MKKEARSFLASSILTLSLKYSHEVPYTVKTNQCIRKKRTMKKTLQVLSLITEIGLDMTTSELTTKIIRIWS